LPVKSFHHDPPPARGLKLVVAPLAARHLDQVMDLERLCFPRPWPRRVFEAMAIHPNSIALVAQTLPAQKVIGAICLMLEDERGDSPDDSRVQVQTLAVLPDYRRRGVAAHLLQTALREAHRRGARSAVLEVRPSNLAAQGLYRSAGFEKWGRKPGYYVLPPEDALVLGCDLRSRFGAAGENG
jgi:ribosomal-protein-alanine N-acetyltransferase